MSSMENFIKVLEDKVKQYESQAQQSIMSHNALLGALQSSKELLEQAKNADAEDLKLLKEVDNVLESLDD